MMELELVRICLHMYGEDHRVNFLIIVPAGMPLSEIKDLIADQLHPRFLCNPIDVKWVDEVGRIEFCQEDAYILKFRVGSIL